MKIKLKSHKTVLSALPYALASISYMFTVHSVGYFLGWAFVLWLVSGQWHFRLEKYKIWLLPIVFLIVIIISFVGSENQTIAWRVMQRFIAFLIIPIMFTAGDIKKEEYKFIIKFFVITNYIFFAINWLYAIYRQLHFSLVKNGPFNWYFFYRYDFLSVFHNHPTYVSLFANMSLAFLLFYDVFDKRKSFFLIVLQMVNILFAGSRIGIIIMFLLLVLKLSELVFVQKRVTYALKVLSGIFLSLLIIWLIPISREKVFYRTFGLHKVYHYYLSGNNNLHPENEEKNGRLTAWKISWSLIKQKPLTGYGIGDAEQHLLQAYKEQHKMFLCRIKHNVHNSYLQFWLMGGVFLLLLYLLFVAIPFYYGVISKNYLLLSYAIIVGMSSLTESFVRIQGVVFIIYFYIFLTSLYYEKK